MPDRDPGTWRRGTGAMQDLATRDLDDRAACLTNPGNYS